MLHCQVDADKPASWALSTEHRAFNKSIEHSAEGIASKERRAKR